MPYDIKRFIFSVSLCAMLAANPVLATAPTNDEELGTTHDVYVESTLNQATNGIAGVSYVNRMVNAAGNAAELAEGHAAAAGAHALSAAQSADEAHEVLDEKLDKSGWPSGMAIVTDSSGYVAPGYITNGMLANGAVTADKISVSGYGVLMGDTSGNAHWSKVTADMISVSGYGVLMGDTSGNAHWSKVTADMIDAGTGNSGLLTYDGTGLSWLNEVLTPTYNIIPYGDDGEVEITGILRVGGTMLASGMSGYVYAGMITANDFAHGSITSAKIANGTIVAEDLADSSVTKLKIAAGAVTIDKTAGVVGMVPVGGEGATTYGSFWIE